MPPSNESPNGMTTASVQANNPFQGWLNRIVAGAGITSALGDFCYETTTVILSVFLVLFGLPPAVFVFVMWPSELFQRVTKAALQAAKI